VTVEFDQRAPKRSRFLYPVLIASLAVNLLFVGGLLAAFWHHHHDGREPGLLDFVKELPAARQDAVRQEITTARASMKDLREALRKSWTDANALLTVEPFDKEKFKAALAQLGDAETRYKAAIYNALADTAEKLDPDERKLLQSWRERRRPPVLIRSGERAGNEGKPD
jgi:uncharacterized membrane protein